MRRTATFIMLTCLYAVAALLGAGPASACSCVGGTTEEFFDGADAVFTARLVSREEPATVTSSADPALHVFAVDRVYKGTANESQDVLSPVSGATCGLELTGDGPFVVYATRSADPGGAPFTTLAGDQYAAFLCGGTGAVTPDIEAELAALVGGSGDQGLPTTPLPRDGETEPAGSSRLPIGLAAVAGVVVLGAGVLLLRRRRVAPR